ncbi:lysylphosphatidylglycerol synthase transmembrane domain-containing protein [Roseovarius sp. B08]|uniref:lysylphosphatidylglycerol synthase transmembrane domain-containing protein n=1 Tax=Roseovarius sp. B08 TaxID=3449223 RepID=UPI003EDC53A9
MKMWVIKLLVSAALMAAMLWWTDTAQVGARLARADWGWLAVSLAALTLATLSMARRWQLTAQALEIPIGFGAAVREYYVAQLINSVLPGGVLGDVGRAVRVRRQADLARAGQSVAAERLMGQVAMFALLALGLIGAVLVPGGIAWPGGVWALLVALPVLCAVALWGARRFETTRSFPALVWRLIGHQRIVVHALLGALLLVLGLYAAARATGSVIPPEGLFTVLPLVFCAMLVPLSVAGWGWREGAAAALFPLIGLDANAGVAMGICYGAMMLVSALPGLAFLWVPGGVRAAPERAGPS